MTPPLVGFDSRQSAGQHQDAHSAGTWIAPDAAMPPCGGENSPATTVGSGSGVAGLQLRRGPAPMRRGCPLLAGY